MTAEPATKVFGRSVDRIEDGPLLTGTARFVDDIRLPGMVEAAFVRSPHAHARIVSIDASAALALTGVHAVWTHADIAPHLATDLLEGALPSAAFRLEVHRPVLPREEVAYVGEPVAVVIADDRYVAEDAAALVAVEYEPLPAVADCRDALAEGAPTVYSGAPHNLVAAFPFAYGEPDAAFEGAAHVVRESLWQHRGGGHSMECRGVLAHEDPLDGLLTVRSSTQTPAVAKRLLCDLLGRDPDTVRVATPDVGGGFGPKLVFYSEEAVVAVAAVKAGRPVKWIEDRREHFVSSTQERDQYWDIEAAADADGRLLAVRGRLVHDHGAYTARGINIPTGAAMALALPYDIPACRIDVSVALTNKVPVTPVRGAGQPQGTFAIERLMDRLAAATGLDRAEIRRRNLVPPDRMPCEKPFKLRGGTTVVLDGGDYPAMLAAALDRTGWADFPERQRAAREEGRHVGIGLAVYVEGTGRGPFEPVRVAVGASGRIRVASGATAIGQGTATMLAQIVAEQLGGDMGLIDVTCGDTAAIDHGFGAFNSRQAVIAGSAAHAAALAVREKALKVAGEMLEAAPEDLDWQGGRIAVKGVEGHGIAVGDVARALEGMPGYRLPGGERPGLAATEAPVFDDMVYAAGACVAEVEVDAQTGNVRVDRIVLAHDCGRMINPKLVDGQIVGGIAHGLGNALFEWMGFDENAQPVTTNYGEYLLVTATEMPAVEIIHRESPSPLNPLGIKGVGESGVIPTAAAVASAVEDALSPFGVKVRRAPLTPMDVVAAITEGSAP